MTSGLIETFRARAVQISEDIGYGMILPDKPSNKIWAASGVCLGFAMIGGATLTKNPWHLLNALAMLSLAANNYSAHGASIRIGLKYPKAHLYGPENDL